MDDTPKIIKPNEPTTKWKTYTKGNLWSRVEMDDAPTISNPTKLSQNEKLTWRVKWAQGEIEDDPNFIQPNEAATKWKNLHQG